MSPTRVETDPVEEAYKRNLDRTLLRENFRLSPTERIEKLVSLQRFAAELRAETVTDFEGLLRRPRGGLRASARAGDLVLLPAPPASPRETWGRVGRRIESPAP